MKNNESVKREICAFILDLAVFERKLRKACEDAEHGLNNSFKNKLDLETLQNLNLEISPICFDFMKKLGVELENKMKTLHLFAGAGGGIIADMMLGNIPLAAVEIDPFCRSVLKARQDDGSLPFFPIFEDVRSFDG